MLHLFKINCIAHAVALIVSANQGPIQQFILGTNFQNLLAGGGVEFYFADREKD